eukprot:SAG31_NODE_5986_length_2225_cov_1.432267_2_plen_68_part_00
MICSSIVLEHWDAGDFSELRPFLLCPSYALFAILNWALKDMEARLTMLIGSTGYNMRKGAEAVVVYA